MLYGHQVVSSDDELVKTIEELSQRSDLEQDRCWDKSVGCRHLPIPLVTADSMVKLQVESSMFS